MEKGDVSRWWVFLFISWPNEGWKDAPCKTTTFGSDPPGGGQIDPEVANFREQFEGRDLLDQLVRRGVQQMLQKAIEAEVQEFLQQHDDRRDEHGNRLMVRNGHKPSRKIVTGAGALEVQQPRVGDKSPHKDQRGQFSSAILPPYLRRRKPIEEFIPWLYLKGISTRDFSEALQTLLGEQAKGLSPNVIVRLSQHRGCFRCRRNAERPLHGH